MKGFAVQGRWFLPGSDTKSVAGSLTFHRHAGLRLLVTSSLSGDSHFSFADDESHPCVYGVIEKAWRGRTFVTLSSLTREKVTLAIPGFQSEEYRVRVAYFANQNLIEEFPVHSCRIRLEHLNAWAGAGTTGWIQRLALSGPVSMAYDKPDVKTARIDERLEVSLDFSASWRIRGATISAFEYASFVAKWSSPVNAIEAMKATVSPLIQLMALMTDRPARVIGVTVSTESEKAPVVVVASWMANRSQAAKRTSSAAEEFLFRFSDIADRFELLVSDWYAFRQANSAFVGAFFGYTAAPPVFAEQKFLLLLHSVRLLALSQGGAVNSQNDLSRTAAVAWVLEQLRELCAAVLSALPATFLDELEATERDIDNGREVSGVKLIWFVESTRWLVKAYILCSLKASSDRVGPLLAANEEMRFALQRLGGQA